MREWRREGDVEHRRPLKVVRGEEGLAKRRRVLPTA